MPNFNSQNGQVGFGIQSVKGTPVAATRFTRLRSGSLGGDRELLVPDPEIGGGRTVSNTYLGPVSFSGSLEFYPRMEMLAMLLSSALGAASSSDNAGSPVVGTHVFNEALAGSWLTVEERLGGAGANELESFQYTDARVNMLRLEADANGFLMGSADILALKGVSGFTDQTTPAYDETPLMVGSKVTFSFGGVDLRAKSFSFEINNNIEDDDFRLGSVYMYDAVPKRLEISMTAEYRPEDSAAWKRAMWGSSTATEAQAGTPAYQGAVSIVMESYETIDPGVTDTPYSLTLTIPAATISPFKINPSGDDVISNEIELTAIQPSSATPMITATVENGLATVS